MKNCYRNLSSLTPEDSTAFGSKSVSLARLIRKGYNIPEGYSISADSFKEFCAYNGVYNYLEEDIPQKVLSGQFPDHIKEAVLHIWESLALNKNEALIVRSSAIGEDGENHSFAGIFSSILNIRTYADLEEGIKRCWISYFSKRAALYMKDNNIKAEGMGVIIQSLVEGDKSGVLFTVSPIQDDTDTNSMLIEAYPGLNIAVVDGNETADKFIVSRDGQVIYQDIYTKRVQYQPHKHSFKIAAKSMEQDKRNIPALTQEEVKGLITLCSNIEKIFQRPCDIEWTIKNGTVYILQVRPITNRPESSVKVYFDSDIPEDVDCSLLDRYAEPACTCYLSMLQSWENNVYLSFYEKLDGWNYEEKPLHFYFNRVYWNLKFQRNSFDDLPFDSPGFQYLDKKFKIIKLMLNGYKNWYSRLNKYEESLNEISGTDYSALTLDELCAVLNKVIDLLCNFIGKDHFQFLGLAQVCYNLLSKKLSGLQASKKIIAEAIEAAVSKNMTAKSNSELMRLAWEVCHNYELESLFMEEKTEDIYLKLQGSYAKERFKDKFDHFILKHGHRGTSCDDLFHPHWREDLSAPLEIIKRLISHPEKLFENNIHSKSKIKQNCRTTIRRHIDSLHNNFIKRVRERMVTNTLVELTGEYMALRENQRYYFDKSWIIIRRVLLCIGGKLVGNNVLTEDTGIFHLTIDEINMLCSSDNVVLKKDWNYIVKKREKVYERNKRTIPPYTIKNCEFIKLQKSEIRSSYKAIGVSPGIAAGTVRVVSSIKDLDNVRSGDIVVVSTFHPSWTPILCIASGLVMEYGNILSHGAVMAREYGVPVVVFNGEATSTFSDDQWIEIDGTTGRIRIPHNTED